MANAKRVAVVNHDAVFLRLVEQILTDGGYEVTLCPSGSASHEVIAEGQPDVVMIDTWLENRDQGWLVLQTMRLDKATSHIPILLTSSDAEEVKRRSGELRAMTNVLILPKPFDPDGLLDAIDRLTDPARHWDTHGDAIIQDAPPK